MRKRDRKSLSDEQRCLATDPLMRRRAAWMARKFARHAPWLGDDFEASAYLGLCLAAVDFDTARGCVFWTKAQYVIRTKLLDCLRYERPKGYRRVGGGPATEWLREEPVGESDGAVRDVDAEDAIAAAACRLSPSRRTALLATLRHPNRRIAGRAEGLANSTVTVQAAKAIQDLKSDPIARSRLAGLRTG